MGLTLIEAAKYENRLEHLALLKPFRSWTSCWRASKQANHYASSCSDSACSGPTSSGLYGQDKVVQRQLRLRLLPLQSAG